MASKFLTMMMTRNDDAAAFLAESITANQPGIGDNKGPAFADTFDAANAVENESEAIELATSMAKTAQGAGEFAEQASLAWWMATATAMVKLKVNPLDENTGKATAIKYIRTRFPELVDGHKSLPPRISRIRAFYKAAKSGVLQDIATKVMTASEGGESLENMVYSTITEGVRLAKAKGKADTIPVVAPTVGFINDLVSGKAREKKRAEDKAKKEQEAKDRDAKTSANDLVLAVIPDVARKLEDEEQIEALAEQFKQKLVEAWKAAHPPASAKALKAQKKK